MNEVSVQPEWCRKLPVQQQSVLFLAARGPDGVGKSHPCKRVQRAYRACVLIAAKYGRSLLFGERADGFMGLDEFARDNLWSAVVDGFFDTSDELPHHYLMHLMHGVQILGYKHPEPEFRGRWEDFYLAMVKDAHLKPESEEEMDIRLGDWGRESWDE